MADFDIEGARKEGYSDEEIKSYLESKRPKLEVNEPNEGIFSKIGKNARNFYQSIMDPYRAGVELPPEKSPIDEKLLKNKPNFDIQGAINEGYSPEEINNYLRESKPKQSFIDKTARVLGQGGLGFLENKFIPYELGVAPLASKEAQNVSYRETLGEDLERLMEKNAMGDWDEQDQAQFDSITEQLKDPRKSMENVQTADLGVRSLAEKATGLDLKPEGVLEKAANWIGFIKQPQNAKNLFQIGMKPKELIKAVMPTGTDVIRGLSVGTAMEMAEQGEFGPLGHLGAVIAADVMGHAPTAIGKAIVNPKKSAAQFVNLITRNNTKKQLTAQLASDFEKSGIQIDAGTLTQSPLVQSMQARLAQSGLVGDALDQARKEMSSQITREYQSIVSELGELTFENNFQASEAVKDALKTQETILDINLDHSRKGRSLQGRVDTWERPNHQQDLLNRIAPQEFTSSAQAGQDLKTVAEDIKRPIKEEFNQRWTALNNEIAQIPMGPQQELAREMRNFVQEHRGSLLLGESNAEARVVQSAERLMNRLMTQEGGLIGVTLEDLIKTKRTLADIADYEFGGSNFQSAYKKLVGDVDNAITRTLQEQNPALLETFQELNAEYSQFKDLFENKNVMPLFQPKNENYNAMLNSFVTNPDKLRALEDIMYNSPRGQELINQVKRDYAKKIIDKPNVSPRDIRDLSQVLGPDFNDAIAQFEHDLAYDLAHPNAIPAPQRPLGISAQLPQTTGKPITKGRVKETGVHAANEGARKKMYEYLSKKSPDQVMNEFNKIDGIRKMKKILSLTPEGKELFKQLSRHKLAEMIDSKMIDGVTQQIKLGTFGNLLKDKKSRAIVKELLGKSQFERLRLLQKNSAQLAKSAERFFNASKSGTTLLDMSLVGSAVTGVLTGNPFMAVPAMAKIGGSYILANLLADPVFIKELEKAMLSKSTVNFTKYLQKAEPHAKRVIREASKSED